jgi:hypothetical protein
MEEVQKPSNSVCFEHKVYQDLYRCQMFVYKNKHHVFLDLNDLKKSDGKTTTLLLTLYNNNKIIH